MAIVAKKPERTFAPCPEGLHHAVCVDVIDLGIKSSPYGEKHKVEIRWQVEAVNPDTNHRFDVREWYTLSLHEKSTLRKNLETWRGRKFTEPEIADGFDVEKLIGANCQLQVFHKAGDGGGIYANVSAIVPTQASVPKLQPRDYVRQKDRQPGPIGGPAVELPVDDIPF